jgi:hypothetical protein
MRITCRNPTLNQLYGTLQTLTFWRMVGTLTEPATSFGYAVECAIKSAIEATRPAAGAPHVHLPHLVERAKKALQGRRRHAVFTVLAQDGFMDG